MNVIHVGFPKTGTTFLQKSIFPKLKSWNFIDYHQSDEVFNDLVYLDKLDYSSDAVELRLQKYAKSGANNIASYEALTGAPFTYKGLNRSEAPARLKNLGFDKVIITIRNQNDILDSLYRQYIVQGGVLKFKAFINSEGKFNRYTSAFNPDYLKYDRLIELYYATFGRENVLVLCQEWMRKDSELIASKLSDFLGEPVDFKAKKSVNKAMTNWSVNLLRIINHFTFNSQRPNQLLTNYISTKNIWKVLAVIIDPYFMRFFSRRKSYLNASTQTYFKEYYADSNLRLAELVDIDLNALGYA